jgi:hypothetical protein
MIEFTGGVRYAKFDPPEMHRIPRMVIDALYGASAGMKIRNYMTLYPGSDRLGSLLKAFWKCSTRSSVSSYAPLPTYKNCRVSIGGLCHVKAIEPS